MNALGNGRTTKIVNIKGLQKGELVIYRICMLSNSKKYKIYHNLPFTNDDSFISMEDYFKIVLNLSNAKTLLKKKNEFFFQENKSNEDSKKKSHEELNNLNIKNIFSSSKFIKINNPIKKINQ